MTHFHDDGYVTYGENRKHKIIGKGNIGTQLSEIHNVLLGDDLKHNLLSISQLCDKGTKVIFKEKICSIHSAKVNKIPFVTNRIEMIIP